MTEKTRATIEPDRQVLEQIIHYVQHKEEEERHREVTVNGSVFTVTLISNAPDEDMEYLCKKAVDILRQVRTEGN